MKHRPPQSSDSDSPLRLSLDNSDSDDVRPDNRPAVLLKLRVRPALLSLKLRLRPPAPETHPPRRARSRNPLQAEDSTVPANPGHVDLSKDDTPSLRLWNGAETRLVPNPVPLSEVLATLEQNHSLAQYVGQDSQGFPACFAGEMMSDDDVVRWLQEMKRPGKDRRLLLIDPVEVSFVPYEQSVPIASIHEAVRTLGEEVPLGQRRRVFEGCFTDYRGLPKGMGAYVMDCMKRSMKRDVSAFAYEKEAMGSDGCIKHTPRGANERVLSTELQSPRSTPKRPHAQLVDRTDKPDASEQKPALGCISKDIGIRPKRRRHDEYSNRVLKSLDSASLPRVDEPGSINLSRDGIEEQEKNLTFAEQIWQDIFGSDAEFEGSQQTEVHRLRLLKPSTPPHAAPSSPSLDDIARGSFVGGSCPPHVNPKLPSSFPWRRWTIVDVSDSEDSLFDVFENGVIATSRGDTTTADSPGKTVSERREAQPQSSPSHKYEAQSLGHPFEVRRREQGEISAVPNDIELNKQDSENQGPFSVLRDECNERGIDGAGVSNVEGIKHQLQHVDGSQPIDIQQKERGAQGQVLPLFFTGNTSEGGSDGMEVSAEARVKHQPQLLAESSSAGNIQSGKREAQNFALRAPSENEPSNDNDSNPKGLGSETINPEPQQPTDLKGVSNVQKDKYGACSPTLLSFPRDGIDKGGTEDLKSGGAEVKEQTQARTESQFVSNIQRGEQQKQNATLSSPPRGIITTDDVGEIKMSCDEEARCRLQSKTKSGFVNDKQQSELKKRTSPSPSPRIDDTAKGIREDTKACDGGEKKHQSQPLLESDVIDIVALTTKREGREEESSLVADDIQDEQERQIQALPPDFTNSMQENQSKSTKAEDGSTEEHRPHSLAANELKKSAKSPKKRKFHEQEDHISVDDGGHAKRRAQSLIDHSQEEALPPKRRRHRRKASSQSKRNIANPGGADNFPLESAPYSGRVYVWNYQEGKRSSKVFLLSEAISLCERDDHLGIYDGQDFDFKNRNPMLSPKMFDYDHLKWAQRDKQTSKQRARVRVWDPIRRGIRRFQYCPTALHLEGWLQIHADYAVFEPSMLNLSCSPISDYQRIRDHSMVDPILGVTFSRPLLLQLIARIRDIKFANLDSKAMMNYTFWNSLKKCKERRKPFGSVAELLKFWLASPWLEIYRGQDKIEEFEAQTGVRLMPILTTCPGKLASFWDRVTLKKLIRPEQDERFFDKTIRQCLTEYSNLELYVGQDTKRAKYLSKAIEYDGNRGHFPYCYMLAYCGPLATHFFNSSWVALHVNVRKLSTACAVFWNKETKMLEMQPAATSFVSIEEYLRSNSDNMELYVGQDLKEEIRADISKWFKLLTFKPGYSAKVEVPMVTKQFFLPQRSFVRVVNSQDILSVVERKRTPGNTQGASTMSPGVEMKRSFERANEPLELKDVSTGPVVFSHNACNETNSNSIKQKHEEEKLCIDEHTNVYKSPAKQRGNVLLNAVRTGRSHGTLVIGSQDSGNSCEIKAQAVTVKGAGPLANLSYSKRDTWNRVAHEGASIVTEQKKARKEPSIEDDESNARSLGNALKESFTDFGAQRTQRHGGFTPANEAGVRTSPQTDEKGHLKTTEKTFFQRECADRARKKTNEVAKISRDEACHGTEERRFSANPTGLPNKNSKASCAELQSGLGEVENGDASPKIIPIPTGNEDHFVESGRLPVQPNTTGTESIYSSILGVGNEDNIRSSQVSPEEALREIADNADATFAAVVPQTADCDNRHVFRNELENDSSAPIIVSKQEGKRPILELYKPSGPHAMKYMDVSRGSGTPFCSAKECPSPKNVPLMRGGDSHENEGIHECIIGHEQKRKTPLKSSYVEPNSKSSIPTGNIKCSTSASRVSPNELIKEELTASKRAATDVAGESIVPPITSPAVDAVLSVRPHFLENTTEPRSGTQTQVKLDLITVLKESQNDTPREDGKVVEDETAHIISKPISHIGESIAQRVISPMPSHQRGSSLVPKVGAQDGAVGGNVVPKKDIPNNIADNTMVRAAGDIHVGMEAKTTSDDMHQRTSDSELTLRNQKGNTTEHIIISKDSPNVLERKDKARAAAELGVAGELKEPTTPWSLEGPVLLKHKKLEGGQQKTDSSIAMGKPRNLATFSRKLRGDASEERDIAVECLATGVDMGFEENRITPTTDAAPSIHGSQYSSKPGLQPNAGEGDNREFADVMCDQRGITFGRALSQVSRRYGHAKTTPSTKRISSMECLHQRTEKDIAKHKSALRGPSLRAKKSEEGSSRGFIDGERSTAPRTGNSDNLEVRNYGIPCLEAVVRDHPSPLKTADLQNGGLAKQSAAAKEHIKDADAKIAMGKHVTSEPSHNVQGTEEDMANVMLPRLRRAISGKSPDAADLEMLNHVASGQSVVRNREDSMLTTEKRTSSQRNSKENVPKIAPPKIASSSPDNRPMVQAKSISGGPGKAKEDMATTDMNVEILNEGMQETIMPIFKSIKPTLVPQEQENISTGDTQNEQTWDEKEQNVLENRPLSSKPQPVDAKNLFLEASLDTTNCSEEQPSVSTPAPSTRTPGSSTAEQPDENIASGDENGTRDHLEQQSLNINDSGDVLTERRLLKARKEASRMADLIKGAGPKILNRQLTQDIRQSLREELLLEVEDSKTLTALSERLRNPDFLVAAEDLCGRLEVLDVTGCFSGTSDYEYGPLDLSSIRDDLISGKIFTMSGIIERFRMVCGDLRQFHEGSVLQFEAALLRHNGEEAIRAFVSENQNLVEEERRIIHIGVICEKAEKIGFREKEAGKRGRSSADAKSPGNGKPTIRVSGYQSEVTYLNYRDEKGNSVMGKRHSARVLGISIDRDSCEEKIGNVRSCHVCRRSVFKSTGDSLQCMNHIAGLCDVIVCRECLEVCFSMKESDFVRRRQANDWICIHCEGFCPNVVGGFSECEKKENVMPDVEVILIWPHESLDRHSVGFKLVRRSLAGVFPAWKYSKTCKLSVKKRGKWSKRTSMQPGVYRCRVEVNEKWVASTVVYVLTEKRYQEEMESSMYCKTRASCRRRESGTDERQREVVRWSLSQETAKGPVHSLSERDGGVLVKECSRTEGYDWRRSKRHSIVKWIPQRHATHMRGSLVENGEDRDDPGERENDGRLQVAQMSSPCTSSSRTNEREGFPRLKIGMSLEVFRRAVVAFKFDYMFNETLWGIVTGKSDIHGIGLFTLTGYQKGDFVIEYAGDLIRSPLADIREKRYDAAGLGTYLFRIDDYKIVDATVKSNRARFTNHSCDPNMEADIVNVRGRDLVVLLATRDIPPFSELTFNYQLPYEDKKLQCLCKSWNCIGVMN